MSQSKNLKSLINPIEVSKNSNQMNDLWLKISADSYVVYICLLS
jgi:hypothetical protein